MVEIDYRTIEQTTLSQFKVLPDIISEDSINEFETTLHRIDKLCADNPNSYRLIMPFHKLTFCWQSAYAHGFTWKDFLKEIIYTKHINVRKVLDKFNSCLVFYNNLGEAGFLVTLVHYD